MESIRLPRFKRALEIAAMQLTERDRKIIQQVGRHRFLRSRHIIALIGGSPQQLLRRLKLLFHHGYLERPRAHSLITTSKAARKRWSTGSAKKGGRF